MTAARPGHSSHPALVLPVLGLVGVIGTLMQTMVLPLLPQMPGIFGVSPSAASWIATSTMLVGAIGAPLFGWLGDRFGLRGMIVLAMALLAVGSLLAAVSDRLWLMLLGRVLQGFAVGTIGLSMALLRQIWGPERLPMAVGFMSGTIGIGASLGVPLAGVIVEIGSWRTIFWIVGVLAGLTAALIMVFVPGAKPLSRKRFDFIGALGLGLVLMLLMLPLTMLADGSLSMMHGALLMGAGFVILSLWALFEVRLPQPFVDIRLFRLPVIAGSQFVAVMLGFSFITNFMGTITVTQMPVGPDAGLGLSVLGTGLVHLPASLVSIITPTLAGMLLRVRGARVAVLVGLGAAALSCVGRMIFLTDPMMVAIAGMFSSGALNFAFAALPVALMMAAPIDQQGSVNGVNLLCRQVGSSSGSVICGVLIASLIDFNGISGAGAFHAMFGLSLICSLAALAVVARSFPKV
ncbi:MFS transporter [Ketogulonicigenium vulgare]|uniref:MFS transporter n=1 Tax=Ketogulonicigenium vulgare TaxID=92945 RepID=UPI00081115F4|nr:MFS transporter [Ketogulonicigenium vulgare]ANW33013.1 arabinose ABC transporter permease [Ketogulonicigenium vulgare]